MKRILAIAAKEIIHIRRDLRSLAVAVLMPVAMVLLYGAVIDMELRDLKVAVMDLDHSVQSRDFVRAMTASEFIVVAENLNSRDDIEVGFRQNRFLAAVVISPDYAAEIVRGNTAAVQVLVDGSDASTAATAANYLQAVVQQQAQLLRQGGDAGAAPFALRTRVWYNPELVSADFVVPGLVAVVLMMICAILTSIAITREKETGTLEQILTTPVRPAQVIAGKVLPYIAISAFDAALVLAIGHVIFGVPMNGSWLVLAAYCLLFIVIALAVGLLISALANSLRVAMMAAIIITMLPTMILSGFIFPIASMPAPLQLVCQVLPPTHFLVVLRGVMLKGEAWFPLQAAVLSGQAVLLLVLAIRSFRLRLE